MNETVVIAHITALPGKADALRERLAQIVVESGAEPGVIYYVMNESVDTPGAFTLVEVYESATAYEAHRTSDHVAAVVADLATLAEPNPPILRTETIAVDGSAKAAW